MQKFDSYDSWVWLKMLSSSCTTEGGGQAVEWHKNPMHLVQPQSWGLEAVSGYDLPYENRANAMLICETFLVMS